jgi:hypothetical protein
MDLLESVKFQHHLYTLDNDDKKIVYFGNHKTRRITHFGEATALLFLL